MKSEFHAVHPQIPQESLPTHDPASMASVTHTFTQSHVSAPIHAPDLQSSGVVPHPPNALLPGSHLEHYEIVRRLGAGGMGTVLLARDTKLGRLVAIKVLHEGGESASRLLAEARVTARAMHENIVVIHEIGMVDGRPYMVLEYVEGRTLREVISTGHRGFGRDLSRALVLEIVASVLRALAAAHKNGIIHRDLKPENIMLLDTGHVKVLDFGIATSVDSNVSPTRGGTRPYMSPEQWQGQTLDARSDIWAVGIILYELLSGHHPLAPGEANSLATVADLDVQMPCLRDERPDLAGLSAVVERCLCKKKEDRFGSADAVLAALKPLLTRSHIGAMGEIDHPFAGLAAFQEADEGRLHGRDRDIVAVLGLLDRQPLVVVTGASGAGKSSFIRAGLIPALKRGGELWQVLMVRPGQFPLANLREALGPQDDTPDLLTHPMEFGARLRARCRERTSARRILVFVDQCEELYTLVSDPRERAAFWACICGAADEASSPLRVISSIRSDFLDRIVEDRQFVTHLAGGLFFLPPIDRDGQRDALTLPVEATGYRFESAAMVEAMLDELARTNNPLPLLQFAATKLWEARDTTQKVLTMDAYQRMGGVGGALAEYADTVVSGFSAKDQRLCRAIFLRLVTPERTRAVANLRELVTLDEQTHAVETIVQELATARLLWVDNDVDKGSANVEIVHESLIDRWPTLGRWLDENAGDAHFLARLRVAASQWHAGGEPTGMLWRDHAADEARNYYERHRQDSAETRRALLGVLEARYLEAVVGLSERSRRQRNRLLAAGFGMICLVATIVAFLALDARKQARRADDEARRVREQNAELALQALRGRNATRVLAARNNQDDPTLALAILREVEAPDVPRDWPELVSAAFSAGVARDVWRTDPARCGYAAVMSPDGARIAVAMDDHTIRILGADLVERAVLRGHEKLVWSVAWSPDGKRVVTSSNDNTARSWFVDGSQPPLVLRGHGEPLNSARMSPDGERIVTAADDDTARVWDARTGRALFVLHHDADVTVALWSPDGKRIMTAGMDGVVRVWSADGQGKPLELRGHAGVVVSGDFHPDGSRMATAGQDHTVRIWDVHNGSEIRALSGHEGKILGVSYSPNGERIATASKDKTVRVWHADGHGAPLVLRGHDHWVYTATWSPDGRQVLTTSLDGSQRRFFLDDVIVPVLFQGHEDNLRGIVFSPDGRRIATASGDATARLWHADGRGAPTVFRGHAGPVTHLRFSPDGSRLATLSADKTGRIWDVDIPANPVVFDGGDSEFQTLSWSPDGETFATASANGTITWWGKSGTALSKVQKKTSSEYKWIHALFDASGKRLLITDTLDRTLYLWKVDGPAQLISLGEIEAPVRFAKWSPDGSHIVAISSSGSAYLWDMRTQGAPVEIRTEKPIRQGVWRPDGRGILFALADGTFVPYRDGALGTPVARGVSEEGQSNLHLSPDGIRLLTSTPYGKVRVRYADGTGIPFVLEGTSLAAGHALFSPKGDRIALTYEDKFAWVWPEVIPFSGTGDARLWTLTSYCIPEELRVELFQNTVAEATSDVGTCKRRVAEARAKRPLGREN